MAAPTLPACSHAGHVKTFLAAGAPPKPRKDIDAAQKLLLSLPAPNQTIANVEPSAAAARPGESTDVTSLAMGESLMAAPTLPSADHPLPLTGRNGNPQASIAATRPWESIDVTPPTTGASPAQQLLSPALVSADHQSPPNRDGNSQSPVAAAGLGDALATPRPQQRPPPARRLQGGTPDYQTHADEPPAPRSAVAVSTDATSLAVGESLMAAPTPPIAVDFNRGRLRHSTDETPPNTEASSAQLLSSLSPVVSAPTLVSADHHSPPNGDGKLQAPVASAGPRDALAAPRPQQRPRTRPPACRLQEGTPNHQTHADEPSAPAPRSALAAPSYRMPRVTRARASLARRQDFDAAQALLNHLHTQGCIASSETVRPVSVPDVSQDGHRMPVRHGWHPANRRHRHVSRFILDSWNAATMTDIN